MLDKFTIGHYSDNLNMTGATVIIADGGATAGCSVRGSAPATRETDLLRCGALIEKANAIVLGGGSAFGLEAACGVMEYLRNKGQGTDINGNIVPIVPAACLYDLECGSFAYPNKENGITASENALPFADRQGMMGAATGATCSKALGAANAVKTQLSVKTFKLGGVEVGCVVACNAVGDIYDYETGEVICCASLNGIKTPILSMQKLMLNKPSNTTLCAIVTNAILTKEQVNKIADIAHDGFAMAIRPVHTMADGDIVFAMASGEAEVDYQLLVTFIPVFVAETIKGAAVGLI